MNSLIRIAALTVALGLAAPAAAQQLSQNSKAPIDITADELEVLNASCQATWTGNAEALQDTARLRADVLKIFNKPGPAKSAAPPKPGAQAGSSCGPVDHMIAEGSVYYETQAQRVHSKSALYVADSNTITMIGDVVAARGQDVLRGERMVINTVTGEGHVEGTAKGFNKPGRPRGVFYPDQTTDANGVTTTKPAKSAKPKAKTPPAAAPAQK